jgi:transcriptional regulator with XRE-family HTH domain
MVVMANRPATVRRRASNPGLIAIGREIRRARSDLSQEEFAVKLDVPQTTLSRWELGKIDFGIELLRSLERAMSFRPGHLLRVGGYVPGDSANGAPFREEILEDAEGVTAWARAAELLSLGLKITNRIIPSTNDAESTVMEWLVVVHQQLPGLPEPPAIAPLQRRRQAPRR